MIVPLEESSNFDITKRIRFWNRIYRFSLVILLCIAIGIITAVAIKVDNTTQAIREQQSQTVKTTDEARKANIARQKNLEDYFKCLSVLKFDVSAEELTTRDGVIKALDSCASK